MDDATPSMCATEGCYQPLAGERINGMCGEDEVVDLMCANCLTNPY